METLELLCNGSWGLGAEQSLPNSLAGIAARSGRHGTPSGCCAARWTTGREVCRATLRAWRCRGSQPVQCSITGPSFAAIANDCVQSENPFFFAYLCSEEGKSGG